MLPSPTARLICQRGTNSGIADCQVGTCTTMPNPMMNVIASSPQAVMTPVAVLTASIAVTNNRIDCVPISR